jgi:hypothetical protein
MWAALISEYLGRTCLASSCCMQAFDCTTVLPVVDLCPIMYFYLAWGSCHEQHTNASSQHIQVHPTCQSPLRTARASTD